MAKKLRIKYVVFWKGRKIRTFEDKKRAITFIHIESQQMEFGDYTPSQLKRFWKIKKIKLKR